MDLHGLAVFVGLVLEGEVELLRVEPGEPVHDHLCVGVDDAVDGQAGTLDWVFVHFNNYNFKASRLNKASRSMLKPAQFSDFVLQLVRCQSLMVEDFAQLAAVESKVRVAEVGKASDCEEKYQVRVVELALILERVVSQLVSVGFVVNVGFIFPVVTASVAAEEVDVTAKFSEAYTYWLRGLLFWCA